MSDFFSALAARVVQRPGESAPAPVRPRLPSRFEHAPSPAAEGWGEPADIAEVSRPPAPAAPTPIEPARPAPGVLPAEPYASAIRPAERPEDVERALAAETPAGGHTPPPAVSPARVRAPAPAADQGPTPARTTIVEVAEVRPAAAPASAPAPTMIRADASVPAPLAAAPAPRVAQGAPARVAPPPLAPPETTIEVAIGRIEVRAAPATSEGRAIAPASPVMSLEDYLQSRTGRSKR